MDKLRIGILGPSDIAFRRFLPALKSSRCFVYEGVAIAKPHERNQFFDDQDLKLVLKKSQARAENFRREFEGRIFSSYQELLSSDNIEAVYIPLPPALHYVWAKKALEYGKHVLLEKPFTTNLEDTKKLLRIADQKQLALHENYAFCYHTQINKIFELIDNGEIGEIRQIRVAFGFPYRGATDFRYDKALGGGALLDCGGYPIKLSTLLLGKTTRIMTATLNMAKEQNIDVFGSATLENDAHITAQVSFGMDNSYKCEMEIWGSEGCIYAPRIFTTPANFKPTVLLKKKEDRVFKIDMNDQFLGSINHFYDCIVDNVVRIESYGKIEMQGMQIDDILKIVRNKGVNI